MSAAPDSGSARARRVFVVSGPSGAGKGTLIRGVMKYFPSLDVAISATTRAARAGEVNGREYWFLSHERVRRARRRRRLPRARRLRRQPLRHALLARSTGCTRSGSHVILELELNGALAVEAGPMASTLVWIETPDFEELERRLRSRASDTDDEIVRRMEVARSQVDAKQHFQYVVVNDDQTRAIAELQAIIERELAARWSPDPTRE